MAKQKFKITNWSTYNKALINRGGDPLESTCRHASFRVEMCIRDRRANWLAARGLIAQDQSHRCS
ncbi:hypothetical protein C5H14_06195 [Xylella fastidiosa]|nr:hypothetical protein C5H15_07165 [Xylella fastidiosa]TNW19565.1 hypothetical protein C5H14_06195 [Xylella fastidiosa]